MPTVAALTLGHTTPSARFRVRQFIPALAAYGVHVTEHFAAELTTRPLARRAALRFPQLAYQNACRALARLPDALATYRQDISWLSKQMLVGVPSWERLLHRPLVLDVDDAVFLARPLGGVAARQAARAASTVIVGNRFLAEWYSQHNDRVTLVPTSIDTSRFVASPTALDAPFVIGWTGSRATLPHLERVAPALDAFFDARSDARLLVVCDAAPRFLGRTMRHVDFVRWSPENEITSLARVSVGIMPLPDDDLARGKCSFKMLQYMACAIPVVVSPVGSNADILAQGEVGWGASSTDEWVAALRASEKDRDQARRCGVIGRELVEREYSMLTSTKKLADVFCSLAR